MDINGNGYNDFITGGWFGCALRWMENPGNEKDEWKEHIIDKCGNIETISAWDIDNDGVPEIVPNCPGSSLKVYKLITDEKGKGTGEFKIYEIYKENQGHGLGFGDITGNGRGDFILANGWLEAPEDPFSGEWIFHQDFDLGSASVPVLVADVNGDGHNDLIVGQSHAYGLDWWEQIPQEQGKGRWKQHAIDPYNSQYHVLKWVDIDNDGENELVTGKRYKAHCGNDPGSDDPVGIYYFKWTGESFVKQFISFGHVPEGSGIGIQFDIADLTGNGKLDIVAPGKDGLYAFFQE